jgi:hypothetical protein
LVHEDILNGLMTMYSPVNFVDKMRVRQLASLYFKRSEMLQCAEKAETTRSVLRHRRAVRFKTPPLPPAEALEKDPASLQRRSDGVEYLVDRLEALREDITQMNTPAEVLAAVRALAATLKPALPVFEADVAELTESTAVIPIVKHHVILLKSEAHTLVNEEIVLRNAEEARRRVPHGKHYERIMRAMRETNREIKHLEWCLAPLRSPFGAKAR